MEAMAVLWTPFDEPIPWAPPQVPYVTISTTDGWTSQLSFSVSGVPSNPNIESCIGCAAPSVQTVVTLNLTSDSDLNDLLAGLLDNSTGGLNGTFRDETQNLSSLGLNPVVMEALANGVWDSGGIFGPPVSYGQPPPPSPPGCSNFVGCVWNTVSGVVIGIAGAIYGAVWTAVTAATQFLKQLGAGLAHLAEDAEQAVVSVVTAVAAALEAALQALMTYLISLAKAFISALIGTLGASFHNEISSWASSWKTTTGYIDGYYLGNQTDKSTAETQIWNDIGNLLVVMLGLAAVLAIVTTVTAPLDIGADVVGTLVLGVLATAFSLGAFGGYIGLPHSLLGDVAGSDFSYYSWVSELFFNLTQSPLNSSAALAIAVPDGDPFVAVAALFSALGLLVGMFAGVELVALASVRGNPSGGLAAAFMAAELTFAGVGIAIASATDELTLPSSCSTSAERTAYQGDSNLAAVALGFATVSLLLLLLAIRLKVTTTLTLVSLAITAGVAVFSLANIVYVWHKCGTLP